MTRPAEDFATLLRDFAEHADHVWSQYQACGPGAVDSGLFVPLNELAEQLAEFPDGPWPAAVDRGALSAAIAQTTDLARRCATLPQGLCFISGEAGLVPRRDQVDAFAAARATVRLAVAKNSQVSPAKGTGSEQT